MNKLNLECNFTLLTGNSFAHWVGFESSILTECPWHSLHPLITLIYGIWFTKHKQKEDIERVQDIILAISTAIMKKCHYQSKTNTWYATRTLDPWLEDTRSRADNGSAIAKLNDQHEKSLQCTILYKKQILIKKDKLRTSNINQEYPVSFSEILDFGTITYCFPGKKH